MARKMTDEYIDDTPTLDVVDEADAAFWDEFLFLEGAKQTDGEVYTVTIENEATGKRRVMRHVRLRTRWEEKD